MDLINLLNIFFIYCRNSLFASESTSSILSCSITNLRTIVHSRLISENIPQKIWNSSIIFENTSFIQFRTYTYFSPCYHIGIPYLVFEYLFEINVIYYKTYTIQNYLSTLSTVHSNLRRWYTICLWHQYRILSSFSSVTEKFTRYLHKST